MHTLAAFCGLAIAKKSLADGAFPFNKVFK